MNGNNSVRSRQAKTGDYSFYLTIDNIDSIDEALTAFDSPLNNYFIDGEKISFSNATFVKEPAGSYPLIFDSNHYSDKGIPSVLPKRKSGLLVWCQIDHERKTENKFITENITKEISAIQGLTSEWLGFDIIQKGNILGMYICLCLTHISEKLI